MEAMAIVRPVVVRLGLHRDEDAIGDGLLGYAEALATWDGARGVPFAAYARTRVRWRILAARRWPAFPEPVAECDYWPGLDDPEAAAAVAEFLRRLSPQQRVELAAFLIADTTAEAAEMLGWGRNRAGRFRRDLRRRYEKGRAFVGVPDIT